MLLLYYYIYVMFLHILPCAYLFMYVSSVCMVAVNNNSQSAPYVLVPLLLSSAVT